MDTIRITSGNLRGRSIKSPKSDLTHPMGSREKIALFNMVSSILSGARVLDAFAGSGALGIEALSRGAHEVVFVEKNRHAAQIIKNNLAALGLEAQVVCSDIVNYTDKDGFDLILLDPPYDSFKIESIEKIGHLLKKNGIMVLSHPGDAPTIDKLTLQKTHQYAAAHLSVYVK